MSRSQTAEKVDMVDGLPISNVSSYHRFFGSFSFLFLKACGLSRGLVRYGSSINSLLQFRIKIYKKSYHKGRQYSDQTKKAIKYKNTQNTSQKTQDSTTLKSGVDLGALEVSSQNI
jgi:hypothetical protein